MKKKLQRARNKKLRSAPRSRCAISDPVRTPTGWDNIKRKLRTYALVPFLLQNKLLKQKEMTGTQDRKFCELCAMSAGSEGQADFSKSPTLSSTSAEHYKKYEHISRNIKRYSRFNSFAKF